VQLTTVAKNALKESRKIHLPELISRFGGKFLEKAEASEVSHAHREKDDA